MENFINSKKFCENTVLMQVLFGIIDGITCYNELNIKGKQKIIFKNKIVCLTGNFSTGSKSSIEEKIISLGGTVSKTVNKKINILIDQILI